MEEEVCNEKTCLLVTNSYSSLRSRACRLRSSSPCTISCAISGSYANSFTRPIWSEATRSLVYDAEVAKRSRVHKMINERGIDYVPVPAEIMSEENMRRSADFWLRALGVRG
jgi:hypothetical protein